MLPTCSCMEFKDGTQTFYPQSQEEWRNWLEENHQKEKSVWLILYRKQSQKPSITYSQAVDEALCFGWIDSKPNKRDEESFYQFFSKRNPKSNWSKINKEKVALLIQEGRMTQSGYHMIQLAKEKGTWDALNDVDNLIIPNDMAQKFEENLVAKVNFAAFPASTRRGILEWIFNAKGAETRAKRIQQTVDLAEKNIRANQYQKK
jgi:uncharacterized protein YdeI (YjbR/CyaY-like superfamily)